MKIYYGRLSEFFTQIKLMDFAPGPSTLILIPGQWNNTIGSYKLVDNEDGTITDYQVSPDGDEIQFDNTPRSFNPDDLNRAVKDGILIAGNQ